MKVLLDSCVWGGARQVIALAGHDVVWSGSWASDPGDDEILNRALNENRVLITLDKDFGELAIVQQKAHAGLVRLVGIPARMQGPRVVQLLKDYGEMLAQGGIITAEIGRTRVREPA